MNYDVGVVTQRLLISPEPFFGVPVATGAWYTLWDRTLTLNSINWGDTTIRDVATTAAYDIGAPATGTKLRVTIQSGAAVGATWSYIYIGHAAVAGDAYDFDGTQVQLLWSGIASGSISSGSVMLTSDAVNYAFDKTKPLVISMYNPGAFNSTNLKTDFGGSFTGFSRKSTSGDEAALTNATTGYASSSSQLEAFPKVEVFG